MTMFRLVPRLLLVGPVTTRVLKSFLGIGVFLALIFSCASPSFAQAADDDAVAAG
jgi:hypothetical protein